MNMDCAWYIEWVDHTGRLRWSGFVEGYDRAWAKFIELDQAAGIEELALQKAGDARKGTVRVRNPERATTAQMLSFDDAGSESGPFVGFEAALARLQQ